MRCVHCAPASDAPALTGVRGRFLSAAKAFFVFSVPEGVLPGLLCWTCVAEEGREPQSGMVGVVVPPRRPRASARDSTRVSISRVTRFVSNVSSMNFNASGSLLFFACVT